MGSSTMNLDVPYDLTTFKGRWKYFYWVTNPKLCFVDNKYLDNVQQLIMKHKKGELSKDFSSSELLNAKQIYLSAFHPDTGELQNLFGRMCFQVPGGMAVTGVMLSFYRTNSAVIFWQWVNQSFNAFVNYTNRNANSPLTEKQLGIAYGSATVAACFTAITLKSFLSKRAGPLLQRYVPFAAVAAANYVNIPLMRQNEILKGVDVFDENGNKCGTSKVAAVKGINQVIVSRIVMCAPGMLLLPIIMEKMCRKSVWVRSTPWFHAVFQTLGVGCCLIVMVPTACALFPQFSPISTSTLRKFESESYQNIVETTKNKIPSFVYYNKGL